MTASASEHGSTLAIEREIAGNSQKRDVWMRCQLQLELSETRTLEPDEAPI